MADHLTVPQKAEDILIRRSQNKERLNLQAPFICEGLKELKKHYYSPGALDIKYKEIIAVGAAVAERCIPVSRTMLTMHYLVA